MSGLRAGAWVLCLALAQGCGGQVEGRSGDPSPGEPEDSANEAPAANDDPKQDGASADNPAADTDLGECVLGPAASSTRRDCAWVADERCYTSREMACNCACPRSRDSQCTSGFGAGSNDRVWVFCE